MVSYHINKGIGRTVEFKGLKAQYLFIFAGGLLGILVFVMIMYMAGVNTYLCLLGGGSGSGLLIWQTFSLNNKYGEHGLMKLGAKRNTLNISSAENQSVGISNRTSKMLHHEKSIKSGNTGEQVSSDWH